MNSKWPYVADLLFFIGVSLILVKFLTWEVTKKQEWKKIIYVIAIIFSVVILLALISGNHYLNKKTHSRAFAEFIHQVLWKNSLR